MHEDYFEEARKEALDALCYRARCGAVIVKNGKIIGRGSNGPPLSDESQRMCLIDDFRVDIKPKSDKTCCVHAEWNAILDALSTHTDEIAGSILYFMRVDETGAVTEAGQPYCTVCSRLALQGGVAIFGLWNDGPEMIDARRYNTRSYDFYKTPKTQPGNEVTATA